MIGAKLSRLLHAFLADEVRPQAERAAGPGIGPTPLLALVADVLRLYADALDHGSRPIAHGPQGDADGQLGLLPGRPARAGTVHLGEFTSW